MNLNNQYLKYMPVRRGFENVRETYEIINEDDVHGYIAGSYAAFMAAPTNTPILPNDVDVFASSPEQANLIANKLAIHYNTGIQSNGVALTIPRRKLPIQVIKPFPGWREYPDFPEALLNSFDMDICRAVLISPETVLADRNVGQRDGKILRVNNPLRVLKRVLKYHARGVSFNDWELVKLYLSWEALSEERRSELVSQAQQVSFPIEDVPDYAPDYAPDDDLEDDDWFEGE